MYVDTLTPQDRSKRMSLVKNKGSKAELLVRRIVHSQGFRYRLHDARLPGKPDLVFKSRRKVIFVNGCFWHRHDDINCKLARLPKSRLAFWKPKLEANRRRDSENISRLIEAGWDVLVIWECQISNHEALRQRLINFLEKK